MQSPVPDLRVVRPTVSPALQRVIQRALAKVPADRFTTADSLAGALEASASTRRSFSWRGAAAAAVGVSLIALALAVFLARRQDRGPTTVDADQRPRIAVLYFDEPEGDSALRRVAGGITEELIYELSGVTAFQVISRNGVAPYRDRPVTLDSMIAALRVNTVVDGSVQRSETGSG